MDTEKFYAIRISFHPDPKTEYKKCFSTYAEAYEHIGAFGKGGDNWVIVKEEEGRFALIHGIIRYQNQP